MAGLVLGKRRAKRREICEGVAGWWARLWAVRVWTIEHSWGEREIVSVVYI